LRKHDFTCGEMENLFECLVDGDLRPRDEEALRVHVAACPACRAKYALDLTLIESIRSAPRVALESVAGEVVGRVSARGTRRWALRWGAAVSAICLLGFLTVQFGSRIYQPILSLVTGSFRTSPAYLALSKVAGLAVEFAAGIRSMVLSGSTPGGLASYAPQAALLTLLAGALVIFMMYGMGRWLSKPMEVNSWRSG